MKNIFRELVDKEKQIVEISNELSQTKELLDFSLDKQDELEKELKGNNQKYLDELKELQKILFENTYNNTEVKIRRFKEKLKELVTAYETELTQK